MRSVLRSLFPLLVLSFTVVIAACGGPNADNRRGSDGADESEQRNATPVEVAAAARRPIAASYVGTAALEAVAEAQVISKATGVLLELRVEEGDTVRAGQVLARLDPDRKGLALAQAEAHMNKLQSDYDRAEGLFARQLVSADQYERLRSDLDVQRSAVEIAKLELSYTRIVAPIDGVVAERLVKTGNLIQTNQALFRIVDDRRLEAVLNLPERELATMRPNLPVTMQVDALPGERFEGRVDRVSPVVDAGSGTFRVTTAFESGNRLRPGMFGRIEVVHDERDDVLTVPRAALVESDGVVSVFVVRDNTAVRVPIQVGFLDGSHAEVRDGLVDGDWAVTVGKVSLRDGSPVEVLNPPRPVSQPTVEAAQAAEAEAVDTGDDDGVAGQ